MQARYLSTSVIMAACIALPATLFAAAPLPDEEPPQESAEVAEQSDESATPSRRERLQERRQQWQTEREDAEAEAKSDPETRRESRQRARANWWEDEAFSESLALTGEQQAAIAGLQEQLHQARQAERRFSSRQRQRIPEALSEGDEQALNDLLEEAGQLGSAVHQAESDWLLGLMETLNAAQLQTLATEHPRVLTGHAGGRSR